MKRRTPGCPDVVASVGQQTAQAADLARIAGQGRLLDPRLNPATRRDADRLLIEQHRVDGIFRGQTRTAIGTFGEYTRAEIFDWMKKQFPAELAGLPVVCFSAEPNHRIGGAV